VISTKFLGQSNLIGLNGSSLQMLNDQNGQGLLITSGNGTDFCRFGQVIYPAYRLLLNPLALFSTAGRYDSQQRIKEGFQLAATETLLNLAARIRSMF